MKRLLNTLYVTTEGAWLKKDGANAVVQSGTVEIGRVPAHLLGGIVCFGRVGISPPFLGYCAETGIAVSFLSEHGRFLARLEGPQSGNVLLRRAQHCVTNDKTAALPVACATVTAKVANQRTALRRALRDHGKSMADDARAAVDDAERRLKAAVRRCLSAASIDQLRGLEGECARTYFGCFDHLIRSPEAKLRFSGRSRRPPRDAPNAVLSFLYAIMVHDCRSALETVGLDCQMGFLHRDRPGRASLALDLLEEFRTPVGDRVCLTLFNRRQLRPSDFRFEPNGAVVLNDEARKTVLTALQERKRAEIVHPFLDEKIPLGLAPLVQAQLLARHLRGDLDGYPSFIWR